MLGGLKSACWAAVAALALGASPAHAADPQLALNLPVDLGVTGFGFLLGGSATLFEEELSHAPCSGLCDRSEIALGIDRSVVGNHSVAARRWSDGLITGLTVAPLLLAAVDHGWSDAKSRDGLLTDTVLLAETASVNLALNTVVKHAVGRKRPLTYDSSWTEADRSSADASLSFYSGHSATAFAMATATSRIFMIRHPDSDWVVPLWLGSEALAATTAVLRVESGKHFWSDVAVGALVGSAVGYLVPQLHLREQREAPIASVAPMVVDDGGALVFSLR
jgi:membrane-associated phospholipid phosphatase